MLELVIFPEKRESSYILYGSRKNSELRRRENEWNQKHSKRYFPEERRTDYCPNEYRFAGMTFLSHADIYESIEGSEINLTKLFGYYALKYETPTTWKGQDFEGKEFELELIREASVFGMLSTIIRIKWDNPDISESQYVIEIPSSLRYLGIMIPKTIIPTIGLQRISGNSALQDMQKLNRYGIELYYTNDQTTVFTSSQLIVLCNTLETICFHSLPKCVQDKRFYKTAHGLWLLENDARIL